ncbi:helix-turn-helix transcriptional regulator [Plantactinospora soyae]|uniref:DNA-binding PadR family transcriptional regulator n=1 Tax=Plantactinospora soyae TaxID=1544732 RepID=A0A927M567_9ACTN|nr:PadR family transcriptional regulator [Plantactinospora soyae]MBE1486846.1 DNA-binding PadR family transcriptional regulator [Plantactinospora soyae]
MSASFVLLGLLSSGPKHGYELKRAYDRSLPNAKPLAFGQVYATIGRLERDGLVERAGQDRDGGPDRVAYALTDLGRQSLDEWLGAVEPPAPYVSSVLLAKVVVALLTADSDRAGTYLADQRAAHTARLRELTRSKHESTANIGDVITADFAIAHLDADLRWLRTTLERVGEMHQETSP